MAIAVDEEEPLSALAPSPALSAAPPMEPMEFVAVAGPDTAFLAAPKATPESAKIAETVWAACTRIIGDDAGPMPPLDAQLLDYGLDSLGLADLGDDNTYGLGSSTSHPTVQPPSLPTSQPTLLHGSPRHPVTLPHINPH